jgi:tRNA/rRNA methyltransferase
LPQKKQTEPLDRDRLKVVLVETRNPLNIGAAARAMSNFGFLGLRVVNPYDVAFREARSAVGAAALLANAGEFPTVAEAVADCSLVVGTTAVGHRELLHPLRRLEYGARLIRNQLAAPKRGGAVALLFGSEKFGLSNEDMSHCDWLMRIPSRLEHESMNLGQAVAVCLYELARDTRAALREPAGIRAATAGDLERFTVRLLDALHLSGYIGPRTAASTELKIRRLVRRLRLPASDAETWLGILRQIIWKMGRGSGDPNSPKGPE